MNKLTMAPLAATALLAITGLFGTAARSQAQTDAIYQYNFTGGLLTLTVNYTGGFTTAIGTNPPSSLDGKNWAAFVNSGRAWGSGHSTLVRSFDWVENTQADYLATNAAAVTTWGYAILSNTNVSSLTPIPSTFTNGTFNGQNILGNSNVIAITDDQALLYNPAASSGAAALSLYNVNTGLLAQGDFGFNTFTGGSLNGLTLGSQMNRLIGAEDSNLWYLEANGSTIAYNINTGTVTADPTFTTLGSGGAVGGSTLAAALDSGHFLGIGSGQDLYFTGSILPIPEPSSVLLSIGSAVIVLNFPRRRCAV